MFSVSFTTGRILTVTADHNLIFHEPTRFAREKLLVGNNDEILDMKYIGADRLAVATNSEHVRLFFGSQPVFCLFSSSFSFRCHVPFLTHVCGCLQLRLFNVQTGDCELLTEHTDLVLGVDVSPDHKCAAVFVAACFLRCFPCLLDYSSFSLSHVHSV